MSHRKKAPSSIASVLNGPDPTLQQLAQGASDLKSFQRAWGNIVPNPAYNNVRPAFYGHGRLVVWVQSPVWANWTRHRQQSIISRIHEQKLPRVHTLVIRLSPPARAQNTVRRSQPNEKASRMIQQTSRMIADDELRDSLQRLSRTLKNPR